MRTILICLLLAPPAILVITMLFLRAQLKRFQHRVPVVHSTVDLDQFKRLAAVQMYGGLLTPLLWLPFVVWIFGWLVGNALTWTDLLLFGVFPFLIVGAAAFALGGPAKEVQNTPASDSALEAERDRIVDIWLHQKLPKW